MPPTGSPTPQRVGRPALSSLPAPYLVWRRLESRIRTFVDMTTATLDRTRAEARFAAMGTAAHVLVDAAAPEDLLALAVERIEMLEQSWSRFRADSALSRLNDQAGSGPVFVGEDLLTLVLRMREAWTDRKSTRLNSSHT